MKPIGYKNDDRQKGFSGYFLTEKDIQEYLISKGFNAQLLNSKTTSKVFIAGEYYDLTFRPEKNGLTCRIEHKDLHDVNVPKEFIFCTTYINVDRKFSQKFMLDAFLQMHKDKLSEDILLSVVEQSAALAKSYLPKSHAEYPIESFVFEDDLHEIEEF